MRPLYKAPLHFFQTQYQAAKLLELEGAQRVHISAKWILYSFYVGLGREMVPH